MLVLSTPGAPLLAATRFQASQTIRLGISNGLVLDNESSRFMVVTSLKPNKDMPLLRSHYNCFIATTHDSATVLRIGTQALAGAPLEPLP